MDVSPPRPAPERAAPGRADVPAREAAARRGLAEHVAVLTALLDAAPGPGTEALRAPVAAVAAGRVLAADLRAAHALPPFTNAQMDGFAVRSVDLPGHLPLAPEVPAGVVPAPLPRGRAAAVMTGAPLPPGADTVVPVERSSGFDADPVTLPAWPEGRHVRRAGDDVTAGDVALAAGTRLGPAALGLLAALGAEEVEVRARPRVLTVTGGREVTAPGTCPGPGQVRDANAEILAAQLADLGCDVVARLHVDDDVPAFTAALDAAVAAHAPDLVVTSGGISAGRFEVVRRALVGGAAEAGDGGTDVPDAWFGHVAMQPGGPQGLARRPDGTPVVCLPGNPVSTWVSVAVLLAPALAAAWGTPAPRVGRARLAEAVTPLPHAVQVRRAVLAGPGRVRVLPGTGSHLLVEAARADALVPVPPGDAALPAGTEVDVVAV